MANMERGGRGGGPGANVTHYLLGMNFPATKSQIVKYVQNNRPEKEVLDALKDLPDREYQDMSDVMNGFEGTH